MSAYAWCEIHPALSRSAGLFFVGCSCHHSWSTFQGKLGLCYTNLEFSCQLHILSSLLVFRGRFPLAASACLLLPSVESIGACARVCVCLRAHSILRKICQRQIRSVKNVFYIILPGAEIFRVGFSLF